MSTDTLELDQMQAAYKTAVEEWIAAIKEEEALASVNRPLPKSMNGKVRISRKTTCARR